VKNGRAGRPTIRVGVSAHGKKIERVYMAVVELAEGEGVYAAVGPNGEKLPVVAIDEKDIAALSEHARGQANATGQTVSIICFTKRTHHETFRPSTTQDKRS